MERPEDYSREKILRLTRGLCPAAGCEVARASSITQAPSPKKIKLCIVASEIGIAQHEDD